MPSGKKSTTTKKKLTITTPKNYDAEDIIFGAATGAFTAATAVGITGGHHAGLAAVAGAVSGAVSSVAKKSYQEYKDTDGHSCCNWLLKDLC